MTETKMVGVEWIGEPAVLSTVYGIELTFGATDGEACAGACDPEELRRRCAHATEEGRRLQLELGARGKEIGRRIGVETWVDELEGSLTGVLDRLHAMHDDLARRLDRLYAESLDFANTPQPLRDEVAAARDRWLRTDKEHTEHSLRNAYRVVPTADRLMVNLRVKIDLLAGEFAGRLDWLESRLTEGNRRIQRGNDDLSDLVVALDDPDRWEFFQRLLALHEEFRLRVRRLPRRHRAGRELASDVRFVMGGGVLAPPTTTPSLH